MCLCLQPLRLCCFVRHISCPVGCIAGFGQPVAPVWDRTAGPFGTSASLFWAPRDLRATLSGSWSTLQLSMAGFRTCPREPRLLVLGAQVMGSNQLGKGAYKRGLGVPLKVVPIMHLAHANPLLPE
jgi:hypothetical protein